MKFIKKFENIAVEKYWKISTKNNFKASLIKIGVDNESIEFWNSDDFISNNPKLKDYDKIYIFDNYYDGWIWENLSYVPDKNSKYMGEIVVSDEEAELLLATNKYNL